MSQPLVTIGICTYNRASSLQEYSLPAIEKLTYPNYEVIVVDDCSSDTTPEILDCYCQKKDNVSVLRNPQNSGLCYSRNRILEAARGEIIVFSDDDVSLFPDCLDNIVEFYSQNSDVFFAWGCVYQCHGSHDPNRATFGTGSLFSMRRIVAKHFKLDTNLRYFKTYGCEEHEFSRRLQRVGVQLFKAEAAKANHYQAPAKDRKWRGLGGDLNYLYEKTKRGSLLTYYQSLALGGTVYLFQRFLGKASLENESSFYKEGVKAPHQILVFLKEGRLSQATRYLFYVTLDIPLRALRRRKLDEKEAREFLEEMGEVSAAGKFAETDINRAC